MYHVHARGVTANDVAMRYILHMTLTMITFQGNMAKQSSQTLSLHMLVIQYIQHYRSRRVWFTRLVYTVRSNSTTVEAEL